MTRFNNNVYLSATIDERDGFTFYSKSIREMIDKEYISDYNIIIPIFKNDQTDVNFCKYMLKFNHMIIYCENCEEGKKINNMLNKLQKNSSQYLDCKTKKSERKDIIKNFKEGSIPFLVNVRILIEGFDASITQGVVFYHLPTKDTKVIQILGRSLRLHPLKKYAKIILPFCKDEDDKNITKFLSILSKTDYKIKESITNKKFGGYVDIVKSEEKDEKEEDEDDLEEKVNEEYELRYELIYDSLGNCLIDIWEEKLNRVKKWIDKNKKKPSGKTKNQEEKKLGHWIQYQIKNYKNHMNGMTDTEKRKKWGEFIQDEKYKRYFLSNDEVWNLNLLKVKEWIDINNKKPYDASESKEEIFLSKWISHQIKNYKDCSHSMTDTEKRKKWGEFIQDEKYKRYFLSNDEVWNLNLLKIKKWIDINNKKPSGASESKKEIFLSKWISHQIKNYKNCIYGMKNTEKRKQWREFIQDEKYKRYFLSNDEVWNLNLLKIKKWIDINNKKPSYNSKNEEEKSLGMWISHQIKNYKDCKKIMKNIKNRQKWENFIKNEKYCLYFLSNDEVFNINFQKFKEWIDINNKKPSKHSTNTDEKSLSMWISHQIKNYKNFEQGMINTERRKKIQDLCLDVKYKKYFSNFQLVEISDEKKLEKEIKMKCKHILLCGKNKGKECGKNVKKNSEYCFKHQK